MTDIITGPVISDDIKLYFTPPELKAQFAYSHSIMEGILTCPVFGLIRYYKRRQYPSKRQLALEAGSAMHSVFAAVRLWQVYRKQKLEGHWLHHGPRLFNTEDFPTRFEDAFKPMTNPRDELMSFCFSILNTTGYYDDPDDTYRTLQNMEQTTIRYVDEQLIKMDDNPIWIEDPNDPQSRIGIEQHFDVIVEWKGKRIRYIGTIDGIVCQRRYPNTAMVDENKTSARLDEAWKRSFDTKSQPTGYVYVAKLLTGLEVTKTRILGVKIKQTRSNEDYLPFITDRQDYQLVDWARSLFFADELVERYGDDPITAPQFTHACNRYFRPCSLIDLCAASPEDREEIYHNSMIEAPLTPSQEAVLGDGPG